MLDQNEFDSVPLAVDYGPNGWWLVDGYGRLVKEDVFDLGDYRIYDFQPEEKQDENLRSLVLYWWC